MSNRQQIAFTGRVDNFGRVSLSSTDESLNNGFGVQLAGSGLHVADMIKLAAGDILNLLDESSGRPVAVTVTEANPRIETGGEGVSNFRRITATASI